MQDHSHAQVTGFRSENGAVLCKTDVSVLQGETYSGLLQYEKCLNLDIQECGVHHMSY